MRPLFIHLLLSLLIIGTIALVLSISIHPIIYTLENETPNSSFHADIQALKRTTVNSSTDMLPIMQDLLDYSGPIALNIRMKDLESARNDLDEYARRYKNLNNLVINLEMTDSEVQDFANNTKLQDDLYRELINSSYSLDELKRLEFRYRDKKDANGLTSVAYQGAALKKKIQSIRDRYHIVSKNLENQSEKLELDSTKVKLSREEIDRYVKEVVDEPLPEIGKTRVSDHISFLINPDSGTYRDPVTYSGFIAGTGIANTNISIFLDNQSYLELNTDEIGEFRKLAEIERVPAGEHHLIARWKNKTSDEQNLTVFSVNSTLTLDIRAVTNFPEINATGLLKTNRTVRNAPVQMVVNNEPGNVSYTNKNGNYSLNLTLPEGKYQIYTLFNNLSFPINSSRSQTYEVVSSGTAIISIRELGRTGDDTVPSPSIPIEILIIALVLCCIGVPVWYHRRKQTGHHPEPVPDHPPRKEKPATGTEDHRVRDPVFIRYQEVLNSHNLSEAARAVYLEFLERISGEIPSPRTLTPRELLRQVQKRSYAGIFSSFIYVYELIRYGGMHADQERLRFEDEMKETEKAIIGEEHED